MLPATPFHAHSACVCLAALGLVAACAPPETPAPAPRIVLVQAAAPAGLSQTVYVGEVRARHEADLAFRVGGKLVSRLVDVGATVQAGTLLARLDPQDLQLALQTAAAQLAAAESEYATARADQARYADLLARKFVSQAAFDAKNNAFRSAQARLEQARAQVALSGNQAAYGSLTADQPGVVTAVLADAGQVVSAGQAVLRIARPDEKEIAIAVPEGRIAELRSTARFAVSTWAQPDQILTGALRELAPAADPVTRTYAARIRIGSAPAGLQLGMTARVALGNGDGNALLVPLTAVVNLGQGPLVWTVVDGKAKPRPVRVQQYREDGVVLAGGLEPGQQVVVAGVAKLVADMAVRAQPVTPATEQR